MVHNERIIEAFRSNAIKRILLIDDAYDPPMIGGDLGKLVDFLESAAGSAACNKSGIDENTIAAATEAAKDNNTDNDELKTIIELLYQSYHQEDHDKEFDPDERFKEYKKPALVALRPLHILLRNCGEVRTSGFGGAMNHYREFRPQIIFLDYYLGPEVPDSGNADEESKTKTRLASLNVLQQIVNAQNGTDLPAFVLISSQEISDVDEYRVEAKSGILALRFGFLRKNMVRQTGEEIEIDHEAADALLDVSQGYLFGKALQSVLLEWKAGAECALSGFLGEVSDLHTKDFAYLMRFRLREEGQPFREYLGWLFGECLKGLIDEKVNWENSSFSRLEGVDELDRNIEGAFEGASVTITRLFHRSRVDSHRKSTIRRYRLGDLFARPEDRIVRVVITPDCDLMERNSTREPKRVLTMGGTLNTFDQKNTAADDFLLFNDQPFGVTWNPKDLMAFPFDGHDSLRESCQFVGTLRGVYALEMQRRALTDLSRVGLPVAPALGINATATVWIWKNGCYVQLSICSSSRATVIPARARGKEHRVLFPRPFVHELIDRLSEMQSADLSTEHNNLRLSALNNGGINKLYTTFCREGIRPNAKGIFGIMLILGDGQNTDQVKSWLKIKLDLSDETVEDLSIFNPLA